MSMMITTPYRTRPIRFLELYEADGWRLKVYGISATRDRPMARLVVAAKGVARQYLPSPAVQVDRYGVGTLIVHEGADGNWVLLDWWVGENMLQHHVYASPLDEPERLAYISPTGLAACVWELYVLGFERQAWIDTVLANPDRPDLDAYLARQIAAADV